MTIHRRRPPATAATTNRRDIKAIQRRLRTTGADTRPAKPEPLEALFSHQGPPTTVESPRWYPRRTARLVAVLVSLGTAGSSNTVVTVKVNGGSQGTITLGSGVHKSYAAFDAVLVADTDWLTVTATTVGTGAADLTVQARLT